MNGIYRRLSIYIKEMFPLQLYIPYAGVTFFGLYFSVQGLVDVDAGTDSLVLGPQAAIGFITLFSLSLLMRLFDEFKDLDIDKILFPHRAVPRGAVHTSDLKKLGWSLVIITTVLNTYLGWVVIPYFAALVFGYLTFKWFFMKAALSNHLLLALLTHQPMGLFVNGYIVAVALHTVTAATVDVWILIAMLAYFFPVTAWETARKIRAPNQETDYVTYSKILGPRWACCLPLLFLTISATLLLLLSIKLSLALWLCWLIPGVMVVYAGICLRFIIRPKEGTNIIRPATELTATLLQILFLILLVSSREIIINAAVVR